MKIVTETAPICEKYEHYTSGLNFVLRYLYTYLIVIASYGFRTLFIWISDLLGFESRTAQTRFVMISVFIVTYVNYALIYLAASVDVRHARFEIFNRVFQGLYTDYNALWFNDFGILIVGVMVSNMYWPPAELFLYWAMRHGLRVWDRCFCCNRNGRRTRSKTIQNYVEVHSGETFYFHYKYSYILVVVFVTFTFGAGLPILFPIALMSLSLLYVCERL